MGDEMFLAYLNSFNNALYNNANVMMASNTSREDRNFSREMSDLAWQRNLEAWNMQNEYNLPVNQFARQIQGLQKNGLNPALVYGNSSSIGGAAGGVSPYKFEGYHSTAVPRFGSDSSITSLLSTELLQTQIAAAEANNRLINARAANEEARYPGISAKSDEASYRWNKIFNDFRENYDEALTGSIAYEYWKGVKTENEAKIGGYNKMIKYYDATMAEWLNETFIPGTDMTYRQYMESCKAMLPGAQYDKFKADVLDIASRMAFRAKQGELIDLKKEYQRSLNYLAQYGRGLSTDWTTLLMMIYKQLTGKDPVEAIKEGAGKAGEWIGNTQYNMPPTYPGP